MSYGIKRTSLSLSWENLDRRLQNFHRFSPSVRADQTLFTLHSHDKQTVIVGRCSFIPLAPESIPSVPPTSQFSNRGQKWHIGQAPTTT